MIRVGRSILAIAAREFASLFRIPVGWLVIAAYLFLTAAVFLAGTLVPGTPATMRSVFDTSMLMMIVIAPAVSMRLLSDETRSGTAELLMSSPISSWQIATGKYLAALAFLVIMILPTLAHAAVLAALSQPAPDWGPVLAGMLSLVLLGGACAGLGLIASALTDSQTLAFLGTVLLLIAWVLATNVAPQYLPDELGRLLASASLGRRISDFARGAIDFEHVLFFVLVACWSVAAAAAVLEARRWR